MKPQLLAACVFVAGLGAWHPVLAGVDPLPRVPAGAVVYIQEGEFGAALSAAILKKKVPVTLTTDRERAEFFIEEHSKASQEGTAERVTKVLVFGVLAGSGKSYEASVTLEDHDGIVVFARTARKENIKSAAEDVASKLRDHITGK